MLHVEDLRTHLGQLPPAPGSPSPTTHGDHEQLPHALLVYDEASASARADYARFLQASHTFAQSYVDAVLERMRFQSGTLEVLLGLLEVARRLRGEASRLKISFKRGPCKQFKCIVKAGEFVFHLLHPVDNHESLMPISTANSKPLLFDADLFDDINISLRDIQVAYKLLENFWAIEMHNLNRAIDTVHVDRVRVERWLAYKGTLEEVILKWKVRSVRHQPQFIIPCSGLTVDRKGVGALTNDRIEDVEVDSDHEPESAAVRFWLISDIFAQGANILRFRLRILPPSQGSSVHI